MKIDVSSRGTKDMNRELFCTDIFSMTKCPFIFNIFSMTKCLLSSSSEKNSTIHDHNHPLELGRFAKPVSDPETFLILSFPPDLGRKFSLRHSSLGTNPGRRCGGTNLPLFTGKLLSFSPFKTGFGKRPDDREPVRPNGRSEIESDPGSDRGRSEETGAC